MARTSSGLPLRTPLTVYMNPEEMDRLVRLADEDQRSLSDWSRLKLLRAMVEEERKIGWRPAP